MNSAELAEIIKAKGNLTRLFSILKPIAREPMNPEILQELIEYFRYKDIGLSGGIAKESKPDSWYTNQYSSYQDWFTRNLTTIHENKIRQTLSATSLAIPCECAVESIGFVSDTTSIIRLKKLPEVAVNDLYSLGVPYDYQFINMKLLTGHYHHLRSPIAGVVKRALPVHDSTPLFGRSSLNFMEISSAIGSVYLLIVGEAVVQDFNYFVKVGDTVSMFDDLGHFTWGSQTVMLFPPVFDKIKIKPRQYCFAGDEIA